MRFSALIACFLPVVAVLATPFERREYRLTERAANTTNATTGLSYYGSVGASLSSGVSVGNLIWISGTVPFVNGTLVPGGIANETAAVLSNIGAILTSAGTSWSSVLKTTVFLANISDFEAFNAVYQANVPSPKPARSTFAVGALAGEFLIEIEAFASIPSS